jgi:hypothetical protein
MIRDPTPFSSSNHPRCSEQPGYHQNMLMHNRRMSTYMAWLTVDAMKQHQSPEVTLRVLEGSPFFLEAYRLSRVFLARLESTVPVL